MTSLIKYLEALSLQFSLTLPRTKQEVINQTKISRIWYSKKQKTVKAMTAHTVWLLNERNKTTRKVGTCTSTTTP